MEGVEWLAALDVEYDVIMNAIDPLVSLLKSRAARGEYPLTFWMEMRIMANSDVYLSPAVGGK